MQRWGLPRTRRRRPALPRGQVWARRCLPGASTATGRARGVGSGQTDGAGQTDGQRGAWGELLEQDRRTPADPPPQGGWRAGACLLRTDRRPGPLYKTDGHLGPTLSGQMDTRSPSQDGWTPGIRAQDRRTPGTCPHKRDGHQGPPPSKTDIQGRQIPGTHMLQVDGHPESQDRRTDLRDRYTPMLCTPRTDARDRCTPTIHVPRTARQPARRHPVQVGSPHPGQTDSQDPHTWDR